MRGESPSYQSGFAPRDGEPLYPGLWTGCRLSVEACLGPTGDRVLDWSPVKDHGTLANATAATLWVPSAGKYAMDFRAGNDRVLHSRVSSVISGASKYTVACWFNADSLANSPVLISNVASSGTGLFNDFFIELASSGSAAYWGNGNGATFRTYTTTAYTVEKWNHFAVVKTDTGNNGKLYLNGIEQTSFTGALTTPRVFDGDMALGYYSTTSVSFDGKLDSVRFYDRALNANEVRLLASRRGIANELAPVRYAGESLAAYTRRLQHAQLIGGGLIG